jgi:hypothetical protein
VSAPFHFISFRHVFQEHNINVDSLSKYALNLDVNMLVQEEYSGGEFLSYRESNFCDLYNYMVRHFVLFFFDSSSTVHTFFDISMAIYEIMMIGSLASLNIFG